MGKTNQHNLPPGAMALFALLVITAVSLSIFGLITWEQSLIILAVLALASVRWFLPYIM